MHIIWCFGRDLQCIFILNAGLEYTCMLRNEIISFAMIHLQKDFKYSE